MPEQRAEELKTAAEAMTLAFDKLTAAVRRSRWINLALVVVVLFQGVQLYQERHDVHCITDWANITTTRSNAVGDANRSLLGAIVSFVQTPTAATQADRLKAYNRLSAVAGEYAAQQKTHPVPPNPGINC